MVRQAREMVEKGVLGKIRLVHAEYPQDWLTESIEKTGQKQAAWRVDPKQSGGGGSIGDIGTHAYNLGCFISGQTLDSLAADLDSFGPGRALDDNAHIMLRYKGGAKGMIWCSQVAPGHENGLKVRVYGTKGGLEWVQADPNYLWFTALRPAEAAHHPRRRGLRPCRGPRDAHPVRPSGRLSGRLRRHLCGSGAGDPGGAQEERQGAEGCGLSDD